jgi:aminoglycoside phosphotransferase (APT) family kinase protein
VIDLHRLGRWMDDQGLPGKGEPIGYHLLSGGTQNEIYEISRAALRCAMRIPPPSAPAGRDEGICREWRIIEALTGTDVPHTEAVAVCADPSVLGRAFYLMGFVDGWSPMDQPGWPAPFDADLAARQGLGYQLAEGIALLSKVDWRAKGLHDLGRPDGFHERQVDRWTRFLDRIKGRELPGFDVAAGWLRTHRPLDYIPGLMHGDYQLANVMFGHGAPARLAAIVDWEMGTVGDPKLDLAWMVGRDVLPRLRRPVRDAVPVRAAGPLRRGIRPASRRHRLLPHPGQVEVRRGPRAGLPAGRGRREAAGVRPGRAGAHAGRRRTRREHGLPVLTQWLPRTSCRVRAHGTGSAGQVTHTGYHCRPAMSGRVLG